MSVGRAASVGRGVERALAPIVTGAALAIVAGIVGGTGLDGRLAAFEAGALGASALVAWRLGERRSSAAMAIVVAAVVAAPRAWIAQSTASIVLLVALTRGLASIVRGARDAPTKPAKAVGWVLASACAWAISAIASTLFQSQLGLVPARVVHQAVDARAGEEVVSFETSDGYRIEGTYAPVDAARASVVLVHGVSDARARFAPFAARLRAEGIRSLRINLRAHGRSDGAVCAYGEREWRDVVAAARWLRGADGAGAESALFVVGASMGGGASLAAAPELEALGVRGIVLLAPATDFEVLVRERVAFLGPLEGVAVGTAWLGAQLLGQPPLAEWSPRARAARAPDLPILVFHGTADRTIPLSLSEALVQGQSRAALVTLPGVAHDDLPQVIPEDEDAWRRLRAFVDVVEGLDGVDGVGAVGASPLEP